MSKLDVIRAWKDAEYRSNLTDNQRASMPENPAGALDLSDLDLNSVAGGTQPTPPIWGTQPMFGCPTGDFIPCQSDFFCPQTWAAGICFTVDL
jgi:mersacidin/lichenicidin family type 2 lantibiotic